MSASSSDSWILIALTILVVLLLFYLSKKMICNSYGTSGTGEDSPSTTSPSSSATVETSTSFSDYFHGGAYEGSSSHDLIDPTTAGSSSSSGSSPGTDDVAIDIADSLNCPSEHHPRAPLPTQHHHHHHYRLDNGCNNHIGNNNNHGRNNPHLSNSVMCNGRGMSCGGGGDGGGRTTVDSNGRGMDLSGSPPESSTFPATIAGSQPAILSPISIIASADLDRKTMLETQLRNQIAKIVQAEHEIQRLAQLLSLEQRQGLDTENNNVLAAAAVATRSTLLQHYNRYPQFIQRLCGNIPSSLHTTATAVPIFSTAAAAAGAEPTGNATVASGSHGTPTPYSNNNRAPVKNNNGSSSLSVSSAFPNSPASAPTDNHGDDNHHETTSSQTTSPGSHQQQGQQEQEQNSDQNENSPAFSEFPGSSTHGQSFAAAARRLEQPLSCGVDASFLVGYQQHRNCGCNLCYPTNIGSRAGRMMMLRRILLPLSSFPIAISAQAASARHHHHQRDFLCEEHQQYHHHRQPVPDPQSGFFDYSHRHHQQQQQRDDDNDDPPPCYETLFSNNNNNANTMSCEYDQPTSSQNSCGNNVNNNNNDTTEIN